ncbi:hypothetical protein RIF29_25920 [Crotalaria pallida]|uniref:Aminotransferase-like plant mobile domain-containing protein n=1 Tax=Crotalaria pallida TaxID=3830 RepID=A0AAN9ES59_CROPI
MMVAGLAPRSSSMAMEGSNSRFEKEKRTTEAKAMAATTVRYAIDELDAIDEISANWLVQSPINSRRLVTDEGCEAERALPHFPAIITIHQCVNTQHQPLSLSLSLSLHSLLIYLVLSIFLPPYTFLLFNSPSLHSSLGFSFSLPHFHRFLSFNASLRWRRHQKTPFPMRKSMRLSTVGLAAATTTEAPQRISIPVKNISTKFKLASYAERVETLTEEQKTAISKAGFGNLLLVPNNSLNKTLLTDLMEMWSCEKQAFVVSSREIRLTPLDVALILGLPVSGRSVLLKHEEPPFSDLEALYGAMRGKRKVAVSSLEARLDLIGDSASDDFVRTFLMYTLGTFLSSNDVKVDSRYLCFLENLDIASQFAWGAAIIEDLSQWLDKRKQNNVQYVGGCLIFLQTWAYEHFDIARPQLQGDDLTFPRVCRWGNIKSHPKHRDASRFNFKDLHDNDQVIWTLDPSSAELQMEIIKGALKLQGDSTELQGAETCSTSSSTNVSGVDSELEFNISSEDKAQREDEVNFENQVVEDTPTRLSTCDEEHREQEINLENLIVEDTPPNLSSSDEAQREQDLNLENLIVEDTPTNLSNAVEVSREQEFNAEMLIVDATPPKLGFCADDLKKKNIGLEVEIAELKIKVGHLMEENGLLLKQIQTNTQLEEQNAELKKELDLLREENRILRLSRDSFCDAMDRNILELGF